MAVTVLSEDARALVATQLANSAAAITDLASSSMDDILAAGAVLATALKGGHKVLFCGNGGSAADAQHLAAELMGRFMIERRPLPAIALTTDTSLLTAWINDVDFESVFARQVEGLGQPGDVLVAISTSGDSPNVINAVSQARRQQMQVIVLTGQSGGRLIQEAEEGDVAIQVPSTDTQHIQEGHITVGHILCALVETALFPRMT
ncbi:MAG: D-sedoheptulose 7-phosphate isomerase [Candidatus Marinimicrobia bacterium]|nr:D-sedoheptulose 7-phosphate isomerase [Candidatus Neomarinimicrobiota bacterium]